MLQKKILACNGSSTLVTVLGKNTKVKNGIYVLFPNGETVTTWAADLFDIPEGLQLKTEEPVYEKLNSEVLELRSILGKIYDKAYFYRRSSGNKAAALMGHEFIKDLAKPYKVKGEE